MATQVNKDEWRADAHRVIETAALNNQYLTSDIMIAQLETAGLGVDNWSVLGGVFTRAARAGLIKKSRLGNKSKSHSAKTVWQSLTCQPVRPHVPMQRKVSGKTQEQMVYDLIKRSNGATNWELSHVAIKYTSVISELRKDGYNVHAERQKLPNGRASNTWLYTLINEED